MKKLFTLLLLSTAFTMFSQVGINTTTPDNSSMLDIASTDKGILIPRMTQAQRTAITTPATSLLVYQTDAVTGFWYYNGTAWVNLNSSNGEFKSIGGLVQNTTNTAADDFVFGSTSLADIPGLNDNKHMFFDKSKGAFRAGEANGTSWDDANVGASSVGLGPDTTASGWASTAMGFNTTASANGTTAMGQNTRALGNTATAMGWYTTASGSNSTAMGFNTTASGSVSTVLGQQTTASGSYSTAMGLLTTASGDTSIAIGNNNTAPSYGETVLGTFATNYTPVSATAFNAGDRIFSVGNGTTAARNNAMTILKNGSIGVGTDTPTASALLDLTSTNKGILVPRMTQAQRTAIATPATSLLVYQTDAAAGFWYYNGTAWANLNSSDGEFKSIGGLVQNTTNTDADNFVFGSTSLADIAGTNDDNRMFFNKSKGAFRAGRVTGTQWDDANVGIFSAALGTNSTASGAASVATGYLTNSSGTASTATGQQTLASGNWSTSMGVMTNASGEASVATGFFTTASGDHSSSLGDNNAARSYCETVLGTFATDYTPASATAFNTADRILSVGNGTLTARSNAMTILKNGSIGVGTDTPTTSALLDLTSTNKGILVPRMTQAQRTAITTPATSLLVYQTDASPGFWYYNGTAWASLSSEFKSIGGLVQNTTDTANDDFVFGSTSLADIAGTNDDNRVFFDKSKGAFRAGNVTGTQWDDANVGANSTALGTNTTASGWVSTAMGMETKASSLASTAMGYFTIASGNASTALGIQTTASEAFSTAMGYLSTASGFNATALGNQTTASGLASTAMGSATVASGGHSLAMGYYSNALGELSTAMGDNNTATSYAETVLGTYATIYTPAGSSAFDAADRIFSIGNGNSTTRSNAMTLFKNSNFVIGSDNLNDIAGTNDDNRLFFNKSKGALRSGRVTGTQWDDANVGTYSTAMGDNNTATSYAETVLGAYATNYSPVSTTAFNAADRIFSVGNGTSTTRSNAMTILKNGRVGLGIDNPTKGLLEINGVGLGQGTLTVISHGNGAGTTALATLNGGTYGASAYSIWASGNIAATQFHAYSDARIKKILGISDSANDLQTLEKIEITNYKMADSLQLGNKPIKKVIAQQVEKVYPQAVANNLTEVIPNIYKVSQIKNGWIDLVADVKVDDKIKLLFDSGEKLVAVTEVSAKGFKVNVEAEGAVFVYGKEVHDFRAVDYEALSMLNISATQELLKRIKELEADKTNLTIKVKTLEQNQARIDERLEQLEGFLLKKATSTIELTTNK